MPERKQVIAHEVLRSKLWEVAPSQVAGWFEGEPHRVLELLSDTEATTIVVPTDWCDHWAVEALCREIHRRAPAILIVAIVLAPSGDSTESPKLARVRCVHATDPHWQTVARRLLDDSTTSARERRAAEAVTAGLPSDNAALVRRAVLEARDRSSVDTWLAGAPMSRRQIERRCARSLQMSPEELRMWGRLLVGLITLESTFAAVHRIAEELGYSGGAPFNNLCKQLMGAPPRELARSGGSAHVIATWRARMGADSQGAEGDGAASGTS